MAKNKIGVITTGGTIAGVSFGPDLGYDFTVQKRQYDVGLSGSELIGKFPSLEDIAEVELVEIGVLDSKNIKIKDWDEIGRGAFELLQREDISGVVITHGTDTIEYTGMALKLMLRNLNKPVVLTGSMVPSDQNYEHVKRHLEDSVRVASESGIKDVSLVFSGDEESSFTYVYGGSEFFKFHPQVYAGFRSFDGKSLAVVRDGNIELTDYIHPENRGELYLDGGFDDNIISLSELVPDSFPLSRDIFHGVIFRSLGIYKRGNLYDFLDKGLSNGVSMVSTSSKIVRPTQEQIDTMQELNDRGLVHYDNLHPNKGLVKLMWALHRGGEDIFKTQRLMYQDISGEMKR